MQLNHPAVLSVMFCFSQGMNQNVASVAQTNYTVCSNKNNLQFHRNLMRKMFAGFNFFFCFVIVLILSEVLMDLSIGNKAIKRCLRPRNHSVCKQIA